MSEGKNFSPVQVVLGLSFVAQNLNNERIEIKTENKQVPVDLYIKELREMVNGEKKEGDQRIKWNGCGGEFVRLRGVSERFKVLGKSKCTCGRE